MLQRLENLVRQAGGMMLSASEAAVHQKEGHFNYVTDTDLRIQAFLREALLSLVPGSQFFAEEQENRSLRGGTSWILDPIDGTVNYILGRNCSAVSLAMLENREPVRGLIYNPFTDEMFTAEKGQGSYLNGESIRVSDRPFEKALVTFGTSPYEPALARQSMQAAYRMLIEAGDLRHSGSAALDLAWVACGRCDCYFEMVLAPWDYAAGALIVTEAGGIIDFPLSEGIDYGKPACVLAANPACHAPARAIVLAAGRGELDGL